MAMLVVLFIVTAVAIVGAGFIARSDMALASGRNFRLHTETDYMAWAGLEHARALVQGAADPNTSWSVAQPPFASNADLYYELTVQSPSVVVHPDPNDNQFVYTVASECRNLAGASEQAASTLRAKLVFTPADGKATLRHISR